MQPFSSMAVSFLADMATRTRPFDPRLRSVRPLRRTCATSDVPTSTWKGEYGSPGLGSFFSEGGTLGNGHGAPSECVPREKKGTDHASWIRRTCRKVLANECIRKKQDQEGRRVRKKRRIRDENDRTYGTSDCFAWRDLGEHEAGRCKPGSRESNASFFLTSLVGLEGGSFASAPLPMWASGS